MTDSKGNAYSGGYYLGEQEFFEDRYGNGTGSRDVFLRIPVGKTIGKAEKFIVTVTYLGEKQYKTSYQARAKAMAASEKRAEKYAKERAAAELAEKEKQLVQRRNRIVNQVELAFVKEGKDAVNFVTCDTCNAIATYLGLAYENPGSQIIDNDQITGAWCDGHFRPQMMQSQYARPFKTEAFIACSALEFFYDGVRQISIKPTAPQGLN
jgi:hypothetical protein